MRGYFPEENNVYKESFVDSSGSDGKDCEFMPGQIKHSK
jgi:hypothetical protein